MSSDFFVVFPPVVFGGFVLFFRGLKPIVRVDRNACLYNVNTVVWAGCAYYTLLIAQHGSKKW